VIYNDATPLPPIFTDAEGRFASRPLVAGRYRLDGKPALRRDCHAYVIARRDGISGRVHGPWRLVVERPPAGWDLKAVIANGVDVTDAPLPFGTPDQSLSDVQVVIARLITPSALSPQP